MRYLILIIAILFFSSCEKTEKIEDYPLHKSQLVVNCFFSPDSAIKLYMYKSLSPLDNAPFKELIHNNAYVKLYENDVFFDSFGYDINQQCYYSHKFPKPNVKYKFEAYFPRYEKVYGEDISPDLMELKEVKVSKFLKKFDNSNVLTLNIDLSFSDIHRNNDFMIIEVNRLIKSDTNGYFYFYENLDDLTLNNKIYEFEKIDNKLYVKTNGQKLTSISIRRESREYTYNNFQNQDSLQIQVTNCSKNTFEYIRRLHIQQYNLDDPFAEPIPMSNNILNGYGVFGGLTFYKSNIKF
ncbi:MAG: DUF4249 family protein [Bacteroidota bacterium]|nr:DUF4249 family protein [Bacteroidota bacterium]